MADERLGASFTIDISNLKAGLNTANKLIRESRTQFDAAATGLDKYSDAQKIAQEKIKSLNQIIPIQEEKVKRLAENYQKELANGLKETSNRAIDLRTQLNREQTALEKSKAELKQQTAALEDLENASDKAGDGIEEVGQQAEKTSKGFTVLKGALANLVSQGFSKAISAAKDITKQLVNVGMTFDSAMSQVGAVSGATEEELARLTEKAKEMGSTTKFTASEAADAFNYMAMAGWKTEEMISGIDGILNLAAASGSDLATTSDIVTDALTAMGYAAKDAGRLADVMAAASSNANTNVEMMGQTFQYAAPIVGALGYSMEDTAVAIGLMANAGIKGEKAGTALRSILTRLSAPPKECADAMTALGVSLTDSKGKMKSLDTVMIDLRKAFNGLSETEQTAYAKHIAGQEAMSGLLAVVNAAPADFEKLTKAVEKSEGAASKMADTMLDNLGGDMTILKSQIEGVQLTLYKKFEPTLRKVINKVQTYISKVNWEKFGNKAQKALKTVIDYGKKLATNVLPIVKKALETVGKIAKFVIDNFDWLSKTVLIAVAAFKAFKAVMAVTTAITAAKTAVAGLTAGVGLATKAQVGWNAAMSANPIGAVITAVALLAGGIALLAMNTKKASEEELKHAEYIDDLTTSIYDASDAYKSLEESQQNQVNTSISELEYYKKLWQELQNIVDQNGKVQEGYEERASFITDTLAEALGFEFGETDTLIDKYNKLKGSIDNVIESKRMQIYLEAQEPLYQEAMLNKDTAVKNARDAKSAYDEAYSALLNLQSAYDDLQDSVGINESTAGRFLSLQKDIEKQQAEVDKLADAYKEADDTVKKYAYNISTYNHNLEAVHAGAFEDMITVNYDYITSFEDMENAEKAMLEDSIKNNESYLAYLKELNQGANAGLYDDQIAYYESMISEQKKSLEQYNSATETGLQNNQVVWSDAMAANLSEITGKNIEFQAAGEGLVQMVVNGEKVGAPKSKEEMAKLATDAVNEITKKEADAKKAGEDLIDGINNGISNEKKQSGVFSKIASFGARLLEKLRNSLSEHSPSKATRKMGRFLLDGLGLGIADREHGVIKQISRFGKNVVKSVQNQVDALNTDYDIGSFAPSVKAAINANNGGGNNINNSRSVTVNQYNTYSQQHSRYELYKSKQQTAAAVRLALGTV